MPPTPDRLANLDFATHNADQKKAWDAFNSGHPFRAPTVVGTNYRYFLFNQAANPEGLTFRQYTENPDLMFDAQLRFARWTRFNILQDGPLGPLAPDEFWTVSPDFQNYYEAAWFGCPVEYLADQVPDTTPAFADNPERIMENGLPDPFGGHNRRLLEYHDIFKARAEKESFLDRPIHVNVPWAGLGSDGPFTVACNLFGPTFVCETMLADPTRFHRLLDFITTATLARIKAWRSRFAIPIPQDKAGMADDSVALISTDAYREHVLPYHRRFFDTLATPVKRSMHLCGNATRHFKTIRDELGVVSFDTGFPVDFAALRRELGPKITILGGPHVELLLHATPERVFTETKRILQTGILDGPFVLREGNNLAPYTPLENIEAMYRAGREFGQQNP